MYGSGTKDGYGAFNTVTETDVMADTADGLPGVRGLHPRHYAALRLEILRTGADLSDQQLRDIVEALQAEACLRRPGPVARRSEVRIEAQVCAFA